MDLEIISVVSNEEVPAPEVEQPKKKKGWTLFRSKKSEYIENGQKDIHVEKKQRWYNWFGRRSSKKDKNLEKVSSTDAVVEENGTKSADNQVNADEKALPIEVVSEENDSKAAVNPENATEEASLIEIVEENGTKATENQVNAAEKALLIEVASEENDSKAVVDPENKIEEIPPIETVVEETGSSKDKVEDNVLLEKRKRFTLARLFRRSKVKKQENLPDAVGDALVDESDEKLLEKNESDVDENKIVNEEKSSKEVPVTEKLDGEKMAEKNETEQGFVADENKMVNDEKSLEEVPVNENLVEETDNPDNSKDKAKENIDPEKRKKFTLAGFFRRSKDKKKENSPNAVDESEELLAEDKTEQGSGADENKMVKNEKSSEEVPVSEKLVEETDKSNDDQQKDEKPLKEVPVAEKLIKETDEKKVKKDEEEHVTGHEEIGINEKIPEKGINVLKPENECKGNDEKICAVKIIEAEMISNEDVIRENDVEKMEIPIGDAANFQNDGDAEKSAQLVVKAAANEVEQK